MLSLETLLNGIDELPQILEATIQQRTWNRVQRLRVEVANGQVIVRGAALSYYVKQLAIQAILDALGPAADVSLTLDIIVEAAPPRPPLGHDGAPAEGERPV